MSKETRASDTQNLGASYGFEAHSKQTVELPPAWVLVVGLGFLLFALAFWVWFDVYKQRCVGD